MPAGRGFGLVVPDKARLDHARFDQSHDDWYYKMYFTMLRPIFCAPHRYRIYLDVKDARGGPKTRKLHEVLANSLYDFDRQCIERVQLVRSHESELLQIADLRADICQLGSCRQRPPRPPSSSGCAPG